MIYLTNKASKNFINHNKRIFNRPKIDKKKIFLVEFNRWQGVQIANSYLLNVLLSKERFKTVAYESYRIFKDSNFFLFDNFKWFLGKIFQIKSFGTYKSFGVDDFMYKKNEKSLSIKAKLIANKFLSKNLTKKDIENFSINGVWIGDLLYDTFLKKYNVPTINISDSKFRDFFEEFCQYYLFWENYFKKNNVVGVSVSHVVYLNAVTLRIAIKKGIPAYHCVDSRLYRIDKKTCSFKYKTNGFDYQFKLFRKIFKKFPKKDKKKYLSKGKKFIEGIITGKKKYFYFSKQKRINQNKKYFLNNRKDKIVIYAHSFFDSPHVYGNFLFPDFYEWLNFLAKVSNETNYDWYIKPHPNYEDDSDKVLQQFIKKNPHIKLLDSKASNTKLVKQGLKYAITVYGSCAAELSLMGVKVVNADTNNPHSEYKFCFNPKNVKDLKKIIKELPKKKIKLEKNDIYEFHFMNQFYFHNKYLFDDLEKIHSQEKGRQIVYSDDIFNRWVSGFSVKKHKKIFNIIDKFISKKDYHLCLKHTK